MLQAGAAEASAGFGFQTPLQRDNLESLTSAFVAYSTSPSNNASMTSEASTCRPSTACIGGHFREEQRRWYAVRSGMAGGTADLVLLLLYNSYRGHLHAPSPLQARRAGWLHGATAIRDYEKADVAV